ncbi:hypothetical protein [Candidatus Thiosymbion oneisti]|uniref:hypothetical protein n=1 Tax=Candidatus Thiosymbion oneisti TaxID=589554 RepID=UPI001060ACB8|nr:hypothetical protein [Candidatus Thiosymbion oneisti]
MKPWPQEQPQRHSHAGAWEQADKKPLSRRERACPERSEGAGERGSKKLRPLVFIRDCLLAIGIATAGLTPAMATDFAKADYVTPGSKAAGLENCVRETGFMRRNHMELIEHQRDATVHQGIRSTTDSLAGCIDCHVSYDQRRRPMPVYAEGQFCSDCHEFAAVHLNCFDCHSGVPVHPSTETGDPTWLGGGQKVGLSTEGPETRDVTRDVKQGVGE